MAVQRRNLTDVPTALQVRGRAGQPGAQRGEQDLLVDRDHPLAGLGRVDELEAQQLIDGHAQCHGVRPHCAVGEVCTFLMYRITGVAEPTEDPA
ncbi:hypothetical protein [Streptomyces sp. NPDC006012]|uniref:hypothetical protein n=1 Tax=Streptomyces sp. NPDC006012 TaxID=3364739 RepID=UPI0036CF6C3B